MEELSYEQILSRMEETFTTQAGFAPAEASDIGIRLRVLAGELQNLSGGLQWLKRQAFPQTADGTYLEHHAAQWGMHRKAAAAAVGTLTFGRTKALNYGVPIPAGTVCALEADPTVRYRTIAAAELPASANTVTVAAEAELPGSQSNAAAEAAMVMVTPPPAIETVVCGGFSGGMAAESDAQLRRRLLQRIAEPNNGIGCGFYRAFAASYPEVYSANAVAKADTPGAVDLYVCARSGNLSADLLEQIRTEVNAVRELNTTVQVKQPTFRKISFGIYVRPAEGYTFAEIQEPCRELLRDYFAELQIGQPFYTALAANRLMESGLISNWSLFSYSSNYSASGSQRLVPNVIDVGEL